MGTAFGAYQLIFFLIDFLKSLQKEVAATIIAAMTTVIVSVISVTLGKYYERKMSIEQDQRKKKIEIYEKLIEFIFRVVNSSKTKNEVSEKEMIKFFVEWNQAVVIWGSNNVIRKWTSFRLQLIKASENPGKQNENLFELEKLLIAIRKDLGYYGTFKKGELLSAFINDIDKQIVEK